MAGGRLAMPVVSVAAVWAWVTVEWPRRCSVVRGCTEGPWPQGAMLVAVPEARALVGQLWTESVGRSVCGAARTLGSGACGGQGVGGPGPGVPSWSISLSGGLRSRGGFGLPQWRKLPGSSVEEATVVHARGHYGSSALKAAGACDCRGACWGPQQNRPLGTTTAWLIMVLMSPPPCPSPSLVISAKLISREVISLQLLSIFLLQAVFVGGGGRCLLLHHLAYVTPK